MNPLNSQNWSKSKRDEAEDGPDGFLGEAPVSFGMESEVDRHGIILLHMLLKIISRNSFLY